jgi:hypothetical protein
MITVSGGNITICANNTAHLSAQVDAHAAPFSVRRQASPPPLVWWLNTPAINTTTSYNIMHMPQGRGYVTRLTILVPAHTKGAFNGVPSLQDLILCGKTTSIGQWGSLGFWTC